MAKQVLQVTNFAGGLNAYSDARDINDNQFTQNWNAEVDKNGVIRVSGMAEDSILTEYFENDNFEPGHGLFQFSTDYSFAAIKGSFSTGIKTGTLSAVTDADTIILESNAVASTNQYQNMIIYIYEGTGFGQSRVIASNTNATPPELEIKDNFNPVLDNTSKYIIFPWTTDGTNWVGTAGGNDSTNHDKDFISNGLDDYISQTYDNNYANDFFIFSKKTGITTDQSVNMGYIEYKETLTLIPGEEYSLSFDCAAYSRYYNIVSKGSVDASGTSYGEKVPWLQLYSTDVADTQGSIKSLDAVSVSTSAAWDTDTTYYNISPNETSGIGEGAIFNLVISGSGGTAKVYFVERGMNYKVDDTLIFKNPENTDETATFVVQAINITGLSLVANENSSQNALWQSGIFANGATSKYIDSNYDNNYISNGDFTAFSNTLITDTTNSNWTLGANAEALEDQTTTNRYDASGGTILLSKTENNMVKLVNPWDNSWNQYIYQDVTLDENTTYHLNFLYDCKDNQGLMFAVYDITNSEVLIHPLTGHRTSTRNKFNSNGEQTAVNFKFANNTFDGADISSNNMIYPSFTVGNKKTNDTNTNCTIRIGFAPILNASVVSNDEPVSLAAVSLYKAHNDLVTMNYNADNNLGNPFTDSISDFSNYTIKFKVPENYSKNSNWKLRLHGGQYSYRDNSSINQMPYDSETGDGYQSKNHQEIYFDNVKLSGSDGDVITVLTNNTSIKSDILFHSKNSNSWINNVITWGGLKCQPTFNYINGMLKISDGNFKNNNQNKLLYYAENNISGTNKTSWKVTDTALQLPPSISIDNTDTEFYTLQFTDCIDALNERYSADGVLAGDWLSTDGFDSDKRNRNMIASAYGANNLQGFTSRYFRLNNSAASLELCFSSSNAIGGEQLFIPKYYNTPSDIVSDWYLDNFINNNSTPSNNYDGSSVYHREHPYIGIREVFSPNNASVYNHDALENTTYKNFGLPSEVLTRNDLENAGDIAKIELDFEYELHGYKLNNHAESRTDSGPTFSIDFMKLGESETDENIDNININWTNPTVIDDSLNFTRHYGNGNTLIGDENFSAERYNDTSDSGVCTNLTKQSYDSAAVFKVSFSDTFIFNKGEVTQNDKVIFRFADNLIGGAINSNHSIARWMLVNGMTNTFDEGTTIDFGGGNIQTFGQSSPGNNTSGCANFTRYRIQKFNVYYFNTQAEEGIDSFQIANTDTNVLFQWAKPQNEVSLNWGERSFTIATSSVNIFGEESAINQLPDIIGGYGEPTETFPDGAPIIASGYSPTINVVLRESHYLNSYITKTKFYMKDENSEIYYLQFYIDHKTGKMHSTTSGNQANKSYNNTNKTFNWSLDRENFINFNEVNSYESETFVNQEDAESSSNLTCRYKTSVIANNRLYVGNIMQNGRIYGDRMIKSPIGKYNVLPQSSFIDVAINDGDEITALEYYKDKILQYKKRKVFVINVSGDFEFLEDTFENVGVLGQYSVVKTPYGIAWANKTGCYVYDGSQMYNLIDNVIPATSDYENISQNYWQASQYNGDPVIGYIQDRDTLVINFTAQTRTSISTIPEAITYHFPTKSWTFNVRGISGNAVDSKVGEISNMITNSEGDVLYYRYNPDVANDKDDSIKKWNNAATVNTDNSSFTKPYQFSTKDFTFGNITDRKKLYKVYITYKVKTDGTDSGVSVKGAVNGSGDFTEVAFSTSSTFTKSRTACYTSSTLNETDGNWKIAELKFANPAAVNNIYSFQLNLSAANVAVDFEVNDISIVFKTKRTK